MHYLFNLKNLISRHEPQCVRKGQHRPCRPRLPGGDGLNSLGLNPAPASAPSEWLLCEAGSYMPLFCVHFRGRLARRPCCVSSRNMRGGVAAVFSVSRLSSCCLQLQRRWGGRMSVFRSRGDSGLVRMSALHLPHVVRQLPPRLAACLAWSVAPTLAASCLPCLFLIDVMTYKMVLV